MPRAGNAVHLQEVVHREQTIGPTALAEGSSKIACRSRGRMSKVARMPRAGNAVRPTRHLSEETPERQGKRWSFGAFAAHRVPPCSRGLRAVFGSISFNGALCAQRRGEEPPGFRRAPPWCRGVISNDHGVQQRRFGAKPGPERTFGGRRVQRHTGARCQGRRT